MCLINENITCTQKYNQVWILKQLFGFCFICKLLGKNLDEKLCMYWSLIGQQEAAAAAKSLQSCLTLCDPIDGSPPGSLVPEILQARTLEWVAISLSNAWKWKVKVKSLSHVWLLATPWTAAHQAPPSMGFSRQEYWSGVPLPSPQPISTLDQSGKMNKAFLKHCHGFQKPLYCSENV